MLLTLEPRLLGFLREGLHALPPGKLIEMYLPQWNDDDDDDDARDLDDARDCLDLPTEAALLATATRLARIMGRTKSVKKLLSYKAPASITSVFLAVCSRLVVVSCWSCPLGTAALESLFAIKTLRRLSMNRFAITELEAVNAFCAGIEASSLEELTLSYVTFRPEYDKDVATTLAGSKTLQQISCLHQASQAFCDHYCEALVTAAETKLCCLTLSGRNLNVYVNGNLVHRILVWGIDTTTEAKIRFILGLNVQLKAERRTCDPVFAAIGDVETDVAHRQCLVELFSAASCPLTFEYIRSNQYNLLSTIEQLGRNGAE